MHLNRSCETVVGSSVRPPCRTQPALRNVGPRSLSYHTHNSLSQSICLVDIRLTSRIHPLKSLSSRFEFAAAIGLESTYFSFLLRPLVMLHGHNRLIMIPPRGGIPSRDVRRAVMKPQPILGLGVNVVTKPPRLIVPSQSRRVWPVGRLANATTISLREFSF